MDAALIDIIFVETLKKTDQGKIKFINLKEKEPPDFLKIKRLKEEIIIKGKRYKALHWESMCYPVIMPGELPCNSLVMKTLRSRISEYFAKELN